MPALVRLRRTTPADLDRVLQAEGRPENSQYVTQWTRTQHEETLHHSDMRHLMIESVADGRAVGYVTGPDGLIILSIRKEGGA